MSFIYRKKKYPDLFKWFCIETIEVCCPAGTYGPDCLGKFSPEKFSSKYCFFYLFVSVFTVTDKYMIYDILYETQAAV